jgi:hypothetical protein
MPWFPSRFFKLLKQNIHISFYSMSAAQQKCIRDAIEGLEQLEVDLGKQGNELHLLRVALEGDITNTTSAAPSTSASFVIPESIRKHRATNAGAPPEMDI